MKPKPSPQALQKLMLYAHIVPDDEPSGVLVLCVIEKKTVAVSQC